MRLSTVFVPENTRGKAIAPNGAEVPPRFCFAYRCVAHHGFETSSEIASHDKA